MIHIGIPYRRAGAAGRKLAPGLICLAVLCFTLAGSVSAELATTAEMDQVCRNWLRQMVHEKGTWGGSDQPGILDADELYAGDTLLARCYTISPDGFVVVPVLKQMQPVKLYSDVGRLDDLQEGGVLLLLREMLSDRMGLYARVYGSLEALQPPEGEAVFGRGQRASWDRLTLPDEEFEASLAAKGDFPLAEGGPLLTSSWHQRAPYNNLCPWGDGNRCVVGCVATATAQILHYWEWPPSGIGGHTYEWDGDYSCDGSTPPEVISADFSDDYDWAHMPDSCDGGCAPEDSAALAELCHEVGVAFNMNYGACGSGASTATAKVVFPTYFKYRPETRLEYRATCSLDDWFSLIKAEIDSNRPIQYRINLHSIVCDGWRNQDNRYEYHMNYGWGGPFTAWFVFDSLYCYWVEPDSLCPPDEEFMITHIIPQDIPAIRFARQSTDDSAGDNDGHADAGETVALAVTIHNAGWEAQDAAGELSSSDPHISITTASALFPAFIPWGGEGETQTPFVFSVSPSCPDPHIAELLLTVTAAGDYTTTDTLLIFVGDTPGFADDIESGSGYWRHRRMTSTYADEWHLEDYRAYSGTTSWKAGGPNDASYANMSDGGLITPPFLLPSKARLTFDSWIQAEDDDEPGMAWDGGIVMILPENGTWTQIEPVGGYPFTIIDNPASPFEAGTPCYSDSPASWTLETFDLSAFSGVVQVMFRFGSDGYVAMEGWYIDDVEISVTPGDCGDANGDETVNLADGVFIINFVFKGGPAPEPLCVGDTNGDGATNLGDVVYIVNYVFKGGLPPVEDCCP